MRRVERPSIMTDGSCCLYRSLKPPPPRTRPLLWGLPGLLSATRLFLPCSSSALGSLPGCSAGQDTWLLSWPTALPSPRGSGIASAGSLRSRRGQTYCCPFSGTPWGSLRPLPLCVCTLCPPPLLDHEH